MTIPPYWQPALPRIQVWRTLLGFAMVMAIWMLATFGFVFAGARLLGEPLLDFAEGNSWPAAAVFFASFLGFHAGLLLVLPLLHGRRYASLFGPSLRLNLRHFAYGAGVMLALAGSLYALMGVEQLFMADGAEPSVRLSQPILPWLLGLLPALVLIFVQTFAEEAVFRGYLLQQLRARFRSALIWGVAPGLLFGLLHFQPGVYGLTNAIAYVVNATVMGTLAAFVTLRTGNLGAAAGLHFGNNASLALIGVSGTLEGFSLLLVDVAPESGYMTYSILSQTAFMALVFMVWWRWMNRHRPIANDGSSA